METTLNIVKALADGNRMRIIVSLMERNELCVCQLTEFLGLATATVSRHMSILQSAHLVKSRKDGRWVYYRLAESFPQILRQWFVESLIGTEEIQADRRELDRIQSCDLDELCRKQKDRI